MRYLLLLLLAGCSSIPYEVECLAPGKADHFVYKDFEDHQMSESGVLTLDDSGKKLYYSVPAGSACRVQPMENPINEG